MFLPSTVSPARLRLPTMGTGVPVCSGHPGSHNIRRQGVRLQPLGSSDSSAGPRGPRVLGCPPGSSPSPAAGTLDIQRSADAETARGGIVRSPSQGDTAPEQGNRARVYLIQARASPSQVGRTGGTRVFTGEQVTWGGRDLILSPRVLFPGAWTQGQPRVPGPGRPALQPCGLHPTWDSPACSAPVPGNPHESCYL